ncbi:MAG: hypothetical protein CME70_13370 [Halobacteriovorax sp.]|nr:hypothetical protein [Halobacteriovorax sp.]|tara:strand:- start:51806 stop:52684 length:879 start_codon:yes stop_codon:yes gene_type:complete
MKNRLALLSLLFLILSCSEESIKPAFEPKTFQEQQRSQQGTDAIQLSLNMEDLEVDEFGGEIGDVPVVGSVFQRLAGMFADISIDDENGTEVVIEPTYFEFPELEEVDFEYIKGVVLDKVHLRVANDDVDGASLSFIKRIEVYLNVDPELPEESDETSEDEEESEEVEEETELPIEEPEEQELIVEIIENALHGSNDHKDLGNLTSNKEDEEETEDSFRDSILLLTYDKDRDTLGCLSKCLDMRVQKVNWRKILMKARSFSIETKLVVDSVPKAKLELGGEIKFSVLVNPGF